MHVRAFSLLFLLSALTPTAIANAPAHHGKRLPLRPPTTPQGLEGGFWRTDNNFDPILHLKNVLLKQPLDVTPSLIFADGTEFTMPVVHLEPAGVASIDIKIALRSVPEAKRAHISEYGMAAVSYHWSWGAIMASIQDTDEIASLSNVSSTLATISVVHDVKSEEMQRIIRGTWWKPTGESDYLLALGNTSLVSRKLTVRISDNLGRLAVERSLELGSHHSTLLRLSELMAGQKPGVGAAGDISILYSGPRFGIVASPSIEDPTIGYSVTPHLVERKPDADDTIRAVTLHAPGIMVGKPETDMLFPVGTAFTPYAVLHNISEHAMSANLSLTGGNSGEDPVSRKLDRISLAAGESVRVDMSRYFGEKMPLPDGFAHLSVSFEGRYDDLIFDAGSADESGNYVFQVMPSAEAPTTSKIFCYWSTEGDTSSMISVWNYSSKPQDATLTLYYSGGTYKIPVHLEARRTFNLDTMRLKKSRMPDPDGNIIPEYINNGSATLVGPKGELDRMNVVVSASAYNVRNATCWPVCLNCGGLTSLYLDPDITITKINGWNTATAQYTSSSGGPYSVSGGGTWSTTNTSVASVDGGGTVYGQGYGSTTLFVAMSAPLGEEECYESAQTICEDEDWEDSGPANVDDQTPVITGIDPSDWPAGKTTQVTITGMYFGTNQPTVGFSPDGGISYTLSNYSDTQIVALIHVASGTPSEEVAITVTNNGYGGLAFNGGAAGASATSNPTYATILPVTSPEITVIGWINGAASDLVNLPGGANPLLTSALNGGAASCATLIGEWTLGDPVDLTDSAGTLAPIDQSYANAWLLAHSSNAAPPTSINPSLQEAAGNYRLFNDFGNGSGSYTIGSTPDPCGVGKIFGWTVSLPGQASPYMGATGKSPSGEYYQLGEGRIGPIGQLVSETINGGRTVPWIWSLIEFDSSGNPTTTNHAIFPTYSVYRSGSQTAVYPQSAVSTFTAYDQTYQLTPSQIP